MTANKIRFIKDYLDKTLRGFGIDTWTWHKADGIRSEKNHLPGVGRLKITWNYRSGTRPPNNYIAILDKQPGLKDKTYSMSVYHIEKNINMGDFNELYLVKAWSCIASYEECVKFKIIWSFREAYVTPNEWYFSLQYDLRKSLKDFKRKIK